MKVLALLLALLAAPRLSADDSAMLGEYMRRAEAFGFSGSVLVARGNDILLERTTRGISPHDPFYVASISKPFTAAAILRLEMDGRLAVTDSIAKYLPDVPEPMRAITIRQLLTHTAGLGRVDMPHGATRDELVHAVLHAPPRFAAGERFGYSNEGYVLLAALIERISGEPFARYMHEYIFDPAGMIDTRIVTETSGVANVRVRRGGHDQGDAFIAHHRPYSFDEQGATGVVTTAADLYRWTLALRGTKILSDAAKREYEMPRAEGYAYGWATTTTQRGTRLVMHEGLLFPEGWNADFRRYVDEDVVVIVLSNVYRRDALGDLVTVALTRILFGGRVDVPPDANGIATVEGEFVLPTGGRFVVHDGELEAIGQDAVNALQGEPIDAFASDNERTRALIESLSHGTSSDAQLAQTWKELVARFGAFQSFEIMHTARRDLSDAETTTFARLHFAHGTTVGRYIWSDGKLAGSFDIYSFDGPMQEVESFPAPRPLVALRGGGYAVWDFDGNSTAIRIDGDTMRVIAGGGAAITASRARPRG